MKQHLFFLSIVLFLVTISVTASAQFTLFNTSNSNLVSDDCSRIAIDCNNRPWIGHANNGASVMDSSGNSFINYNSTDSPLYGQFVSFIIPDGNRMWMNEYSHGLFLHETNLWTTISWLPDYSVYGLYKTGNYMWIGTREAGIFKLNLGTGKYDTYDIFNGLPTNYILRITGDTLGNIYAGTGMAGALKFDGSVWTNYTTWNSPLPSNDVYSVACDKYGNVWFGTYHGLAKLSPTGSWTVYDSVTTGLPGNYIRTLVPFNNNLVVATGFGGLGILNISTNEWTVFNTQNSNLPVNTVFDAAVSDSGKIWITLANHGIAELSESWPLIVHQVSSESNLNIYPNPTGKNIHIDYKGNLTGSYSIDLLSFDGKIMTQTSGMAEMGSLQKIMDVSFLPAGVYFVKITGANSRVSKKFSVIK